VEGGESFFLELEKLIGLAKQELHFQTYRFMEDESGKSIADSLRLAALRGVSVFLLLDAYGSVSLSQRFVAELNEAGIHLRFFSPLLSMKGLFLGRRLHHKVVVADGERALIGGINIADKYRGTKDAPPWLDFAIWLEGAICQKAASICRELWGEKLLPANVFRRAPAGTYLPSEQVHIAHNDWFRYKNQVDRNYRRAVRQSRSSIVLMASYFLPGLRFRNALIRAAKRGVSVKIILSGATDVVWMKHAATNLYRHFLKEGIEIYEWNDSVLHGKAMIIDRQWCTLGSFNLNYLSTYGSIETNVETTDAFLIETFGKRLEEIIAGSERIDRENLRRRTSLFKRCRNWMVYRLVRRVFLIMTFFSYKRWLKDVFKE
jgi:cardiolipin synthase